MQAAERLHDALVVLDVEVPRPEALGVDPGLGRQQTDEELLARHFQAEETHRTVATQPGVRCHVQDQTGLAHRRARSHDDEVAPLEAGRQDIQIGEPRGHATHRSPIRLEAMGDKSMDEGVQATDEELEHICRLVRESLEQGAAGFSTSRFLSHKVPDGRNTPGTFADEKEMTAIQRAIVEGGGKGALFQVAPDLQSRFDVELDMFRTGAEIGCQVLFSGGGAKTTRVPEFLAEQNAKGLRINTACHTRPSYAFFSLARLAPFKTPAWNDLMALPTLEDRVEALNSSELRDKLVKEGNEYGYSFNAEAQYLHPEPPR